MFLLARFIRDQRSIQQVPMRKLDKFSMTQIRTKCCRDLWCFEMLLQVEEPDKPRPLGAGQEVCTLAPPPVCFRSAHILFSD